MSPAFLWAVGAVQEADTHGAEEAIIPEAGRTRSGQRSSKRCPERAQQLLGRESSG